MSSSILSKMRKLNWVLSQSEEDGFSFPELCKIFCQLMESNVYIFNNEGYVLGVCYQISSDTSTYEDPSTGSERILEEYNKNLLELEESAVNLYGKRVEALFGSSYLMSKKFHCIIPAFSGGKRYGTLLFARYAPEYSEEDLALCEYGATVVALEMRRRIISEDNKARDLKNAATAALEKLTYSEADAINCIFKEINGDETLLVASKIADENGLTRSVVVNALRKLESADIIQSRSLGVKGTRIKVINNYIFEALK